MDCFHNWISAFVGGPLQITLNLSPRPTSENSCHYSVSRFLPFRMHYECIKYVLKMSKRHGSKTGPNVINEHQMHFECISNEV